MALDQAALDLARAIRQVETGNRPVRGASGELKSRYQFMPGTWKAWAGEVLGDPNAPLTLENENKVAYTKIKGWKDQGFRPDQIASMWNSGRPEWEGRVGVNSAGVRYDVPAYVRKVKAEYLKNKTQRVPLRSPSTMGIPKEPEASLLGDIEKRFRQRTQEAADIRTEEGRQTFGTRARGAFQTAGAAVGAVGELGVGLLGKALAFVTPDPIEEKVKELGRSIVDAVSETEIAKKAIKFAEDNPETARDIESALDLLALGTISPAQKAVKAGTRKAGKIIGEATKVDPLVAKQKAADLMEGIIRPAKGEIERLSKKDRNISDITGYIAERGILPTVREGKLDWSDGVNKIKSDLTKTANSLDDVLKSIPRTVTGSWTAIKSRTKSTLKDVFKNATEYEKALNYLDDFIEAEKRRYTRNPSLFDFNQVKRGMWSVGFSSETPTRHKVARILGHEISEEITKKARRLNVADEIKQLNELMARQIDSITLLEKATGRVVPAGRVGQYMTAVIGTVAGAKIPVVGPIGGGIAGKKLGEFISSRAPVSQAKKASKLMIKAR